MFVSNISLSHCANYRYLLQKGEVRTFRGYMKPTVQGAFDWRFLFHNVVDSTWDDGSESYANLPGGHFTILHAECAACDEKQRVLASHSLAFQGRTSLAVAPGDAVAADPVCLTVPHGGYVMFSWCIRAEENDCVLPGTPDSRGLCYLSADNLRADADPQRMTLLDDDTYECSVLPNFWQVDRDADATMAFIGDSITQGCQTGMNMYEQWAARIIRALPQNIAGVNVGLGYARAQDAARNGAWLQKVMGMDIVNLCLGVNDIFQMQEKEDHAQVLSRNLESTVRLIKQNTPHTRVVLFTIPPFTMQGDDERVRQEVNALIRETKLGADAVFDMEILAVPGAQGQARFGDHPDGIGGAVVAGEYLTRFLPEHPSLFEDMPCTL